MRKEIRQKLRNEALKKGVKASKYISENWNKRQIAKLGADNRRRNRQIGSKGTNVYWWFR
jgi:hypothetical protein